MSCPQTPHLMPVAAPSPPGAATAEASTCPNVAPQLEQYSVPGALVVLQTGQTTGEAEVLPPLTGCAAAESIGAPQLGQYPSSGTTDLPHVGHTWVAAWLVRCALANPNNLFLSVVLLRAKQAPVYTGTAPAVEIVYLHLPVLHSAQAAPPVSVTSSVRCT